MSAKTHEQPPAAGKKASAAASHASAGQSYARRAAGPAPSSTPSTPPSAAAKGQGGTAATTGNGAKPPVSNAWTARSQASTAPSSRSGSPAAPANPSRAPDYASMLNLPVKLNLKTVGGNEGGKQTQVQGTLWAYDATLRIVVLSTPAASPLSNRAGTPTSSQAGPKRNYQLINTNAIVSATVLSTTPDAAAASLPSEDQLRSFTPPSASDLSARVERAVAQDKKERARIGQGVSTDAQALFDALARTLPVRWHGTSIVVMDEVMIAEPYGVDNVKGGKDASQYIERVKKVVSRPGFLFPGWEGTLPANRSPLSPDVLTLPALFLLVQLEGERQRRAAVAAGGK